MKSEDSSRLVQFCFTVLFLTMPQGAPLHAQTTAQEDTIEHITIDWILQQALGENPQIKAAQLRWYAVQQQETQASSLDEPLFSYNRWLSTPETRVGPQESAFMLSQRIPFFGKLGLKGEMANADALVAEQRYLAVRRDVVVRAKTAYYELYWIDRSLHILEEYQDLLRGFLRVAESKYRTGKGIQANILKADLEISSIEERKLNFRKMLDGALARLNALLNRKPRAPFGSPAALDTAWVTLNDEDLIRTAENRQELLAVKAMIKRSEAVISLARRNYFPDFQVSANYFVIPQGRTNAPEDGKDPYNIQIGITLPIWFGKLDAAVEEAKANNLAIQLTYRDLDNQVASEITDVLARVRAAQQTVSLYDGELVPDAERTLSSALASYQTGTLDFLSLLDSERMLLNLHLARAKELANYWQQITALERAVGGRLP